MITSFSTELVCWGLQNTCVLQKCEYWGKLKIEGFIKKKKGLKPSNIKLKSMNKMDWTGDV